MQKAVKLVGEGDFIELDVKYQKHPRHVFLFNKLLLITAPKPKGKYHVKYEIPIEQFLIWDVKDADLRSLFFFNSRFFC